MDQELVLNPIANRLREHLNLAAFAVGVAACCAWILSLPVFPSEDGPVHVYYATVMTRLLNGAHGPLGDAFRIRHLLPPYSLYYYILIGCCSCFRPSWWSSWLFASWW